MKLSENSLNFAKKILKNYPVTQQSHQCQHTCSHNEPTAFQPFQHMHDHRKQRQIYDKPTQQKLQNIRYFKQMGNSRFKEKKYDEASYFYQKAILYSDYTFPQQKQKLADMQVLVQQSNMNNAICLIKQNNWGKALMYLNQAIKGQQSEKLQKTRKSVLSTRKKAYFWLTKYYINDGNYQIAQKQIQLLQALDNQVSSKQEAAQLKQLLSQQMKKYEKSTQNISKKMFNTYD